MDTEITNITEITDTPASAQEGGTGADASTVIKFSKPYKFEGSTYEEVDLAGLENLTAADMIEGEKHLTRNGSFSLMPEMATEYTHFMASKASGLPIEFFKGLSPKDSIKIKNRVTGFFYGED